MVSDQISVDDFALKKQEFSKWLVEEVRPFYFLVQLTYRDLDREANSTVFPVMLLNLGLK